MKLKESTILNIGAIIVAAMIVVGCNTTQQTTAYNSLTSIETVVDVGYSNYLSLVIKGTVSTNSVPAVSKAYNDIHAAINTSATLGQSGTNIFTQSNLVTEATSFATLVATAIANK